MNAAINTAMMEAMRLTQSGQLQEATALIQRALSGGGAQGAPSAGERADTRTTKSAGSAVEDPVDAEFYMVDEKPKATATPREAPKRRPSHGGMTKIFEKTAWPGVDLPPLNEQWLRFQEPLTTPRPARAPEPLPEGAQFISGSYGNAAGARNYKLYVPSGYHGQALPLVVMLHGCTQDPDDFAAGTRMNELAEKDLCLVLYPAQASSANGQKCWNWFKASDQERDRGEPSIIAGMTRQVCETHAVDPQRIYVAGLSAGGAMAVTVAITYPDLYAAVGIHSGLPHAVARDLPSAFAAMQQGKASPLGGQAAGVPGTEPVPAIVFHGDRDNTVHPCNGGQVVKQCAEPTGARRSKSDAERRVKVQRGQVPEGRAYTRTVHQQADGQPIAEHWEIHGAGHAWSGGSSRGSYTDSKGPDASREMLRFFLEHPRR